MTAPVLRPLGRLPEDRTKPRLTLTPHLRTVAPPPTSADWYSHVQEWGELANDTVGDCVFAGNGHIIEQQTALGEGTETGVTDAEVLAAYSRVTGYDPQAGPSGANPTDRGALIQDGLADLRKNGLAGQVIAAYARLDETSQDELRTALAEFGCLSIGVNLPHSALAQFSAGQQWTVAADDGGIAGGHCVIAAGYDRQYIYLVTWGRVVAASWEWLAKYCDEAWAVVSAMWAGRNGRDPEGVDRASLGAEFAALTGEPDPFPSPPSPVPEPGPEPGLLADLTRYIREVAASADRDIAHVVAWLRARGL